MEIWVDFRDSKNKSLISECDRGLLKFSESALEPNFSFDQDERRLLDSTGRVVGAVFSGAILQSQKEALAAIGSVEWVLLSSDDSAFVPAENLIAAGKQAGTRIAVAVHCAQQVMGLAHALQLGVDALVIQAKDAIPDDELWQCVLQAKKSRASSDQRMSASCCVSDKSRIVWAEVLEVEPAGSLADRVCLDFIQLLEEGEALLVGSSAKALCFVQAETAVTGLVPPRPFRVNAGPVHSYVSMADGGTKYLSEVVAGDLVRVVDAAAAAENLTISQRSVTVGRSKIEPRPVLRISFATDAGQGQIFLQTAETVRLRSRKGQLPPDIPLPVTKIAPGDEILVFASTRGTHVGRHIAADVTEH